MNKAGREIIKKAFDIELVTHEELAQLTQERGVDFRRYVVK